MECQEGQLWPAGRACHAACCLSFDSECPQLLVIGGCTTDIKTLKDAWIFDLQSRKWKEVCPLSQISITHYKKHTPLSNDNVSKRNHLHSLSGNATR